MVEDKIIRCQGVLDYPEVQQSYERNHTHFQNHNLTTVEPVLGDHPFCPAKTVAQDRWSLITGRTKIMFYRLPDLCTLLHTLAAGLIEAGMALA